MQAYNFPSCDLPRNRIVGQLPRRQITDLHFCDEQELLSMTPIAAPAIMDYDKMQWWFVEHT